MHRSHPCPRTVVYEANHLSAAGMRVWLDMGRELRDSSELIWRLALRDLIARYKQSFLGVLWAFVTPLVMLAIFLWVKRRNLLPIADTALPYPLFLFLGQIVWLIFSQGLLAATTSLTNAGSMLTRIHFPREALVIAACGQTILDFVIRIPILLLICWWTEMPPHPALLLAPLLLVPLLLFTLGIGFFLALLNTLSRDIGNALGLLLNLAMFATPVIYPPPQQWPFSFLINHLHPVSPYLTAVRDLAAGGSLSAPVSLASSVILGILVFLLGWRLFHLVEPKIAERA